MATPRKIAPGQDIRDALSSENINAIIDGLTVSAPEQPSGSSLLPKISMSAKPISSEIDWMSMTVRSPKMNQIIPLALTIPNARCVVGFCGVVAGCTVSLVGTAFAAGNAPQQYQDKTGSFSVYLGAGALTALTRTQMLDASGNQAAIPDAGLLAIQISSTPAPAPAEIHLQVIFSR
jgi:hypothetical protein